MNSNEQFFIKLEHNNKLTINANYKILKREFKKLTLCQLAKIATAHK